MTSMSGGGGGDPLRNASPLGAHDTVRQQRVIRLAIGVSVLGVVAKLAVGMHTGSMALAASAMDSLGDIIISLANLVVVRIAASDPDEEHNFGHGKIEGLGAMFEGGFIGAAGLFVIYGAVHQLTGGGAAHDSLLGVAVMVPLLLANLVVVGAMRRVADATGSLVVRADALHYATDVWMNGGVLASLVLVRLTGIAAIDPIVSIAIALTMLRASVHVVREGFDVVMDRSLPAEMVAKVQAILTEAPGVRSFHELRTRGGSVPHVDAHVVVDPAMTAQALHDMHLLVMARIREVAGPRARVLLHADPHDDQEDGGVMVE